jgi:AraC-like DNA-binding protein
MALADAPFPESPEAASLEPAAFASEPLKIGRGGLSLGGAAVLQVVSAEAVVRSRDALFRLAEGDVLSVAPWASVRVAGRPRPAEVLLFRAGPRWCRRALDLAGCAPRPAGAPWTVARAGSDTARRAARALRDLGLPVRPQAARVRLDGAARALDLLALTLEGAADAARPAAPCGTPRRGRFREAVAALAEGPLEGLSLPRFASQLGVSERQVSRLFRQELGTTFRDHLVELRVERARRLLSDTDRSVLEVAGETGWSSLAHFNSVFRRRVGITPGAYRSRSRGAPALC